MPSKDPVVRRKAVKAYAKRNPDKVREWQRISARRWRAANPHLSILRGIKKRAKRQGVDFNLTEEWYLAHFNVCEMTGIELDLEKDSPWHVEVDRINPGGDYTMDNCRLVCACYNQAKMNWTDDTVRRMSEALLAK